MFGVTCAVTAVEVAHRRVDGWLVKLAWRKGGPTRRKAWEMWHISPPGAVYSSTRSLEKPLKMMSKIGYWHFGNGPKFEALGHANFPPPPLYQAGTFSSGPRKPQLAEADCRSEWLMQSVSQAHWLRCWVQCAWCVQLGQETGICATTEGKGWTRRGTLARSPPRTRQSKPTEPHSLLHGYWTCGLKRPPWSPPNAPDRLT